jgi:hypothetical protein
VNWLARLKKTKDVPEYDATKPTKPGFVGFVASIPGISEKTDAANDPTNTDPDRWCWPHTEAMNGSEIDTFTQRLHHFTRRGIAESEAQSLADKLVTRDREADDRRTCLECLHLNSGGSAWRCNQWQRAGLGASSVPAELVRHLQRCDGFNDSTPQRTTP